MGELDELQTFVGSKKNKLWLGKGKEAPPLYEHADAVLSIAFSSDRKTFATGSKDGTIKLWTLEQTAKGVQGKLLGTLTEKHDRGVTSVVFSPDGKTLISGGRDQTIRIWRFVMRH
ncbi:MAG: hypothetical protein GDA43_18180 [Hormoscilla sp. SP5CHS1]|nr:hypothetical protein [Hormoscilla sp. SP5CHS1]